MLTFTYTAGLGLQGQPPENNNWLRNAGGSPLHHRALRGSNEYIPITSSEASPGGLGACPQLVTLTAHAGSRSRPDIYSLHGTIFILIQQAEEVTGMKVVVEGCCHGQLNSIYDEISRRYGSVDLVLICGDFQAMRNEQDLNCMACPPKYRAMGDFRQYHTGERKAPYLTIVIGGNHESSCYMQELFYGGWLAPNIYYLGAAGVVQFRGLRVGGLSGIYNPHSFDKPHYERVPYDRNAERSVFHVRRTEVQRLALIRERMDVMMSHDWPAGIDQYGNLNWLLKAKPFFKADIEKGMLGSPPAMELLKTIKPAYWFSAHLHVRYPALYTHDAKAKINEDEIELDLDDGNPDEITLDENPDQIDLDLEAEVDETPPTPTGYPRTSFLALDKCLPRRKFLELINIDVDQPDQPLSYDPEWLAILRATHKTNTDLFNQIDIELKWINSNISDLKIPDNFKQLTKPLNELAEETNIPPSQLRTYQPQMQNNNQTDAFCNLIEIKTD
ncbi:hypothetical protein TRICI_001808 [Trichomonascus ciferrii]|uniref:Lariat debranching enzyme C-terminal domain-containing protein n=1 Tax=Trichomonascus ciferrii TaxID=44093 RepID=A0A642V885_9ASCO|nr:hypothetical protein TRICI_001808 [Trichomonascus ciferrii]